MKPNGAPPTPAELEQLRALSLGAVGQLVEGYVVQGLESDYLEEIMLSYLLTVYHMGSRSKEDTPDDVKMDFVGKATVVGTGNGEHNMELIGEPGDCPWELEDIGKYFRVIITPVGN